MIRKKCCEFRCKKRGGGQKIIPKTIGPESGAGWLQVGRGGDGRNFTYKDYLGHK